MKPTQVALEPPAPEPGLSAVAGAASFTAANGEDLAELSASEDTASSFC